MAESKMLRASDCRAIMGLVGECRELGDDGQTWRLHLGERLAHLVGADVADVGESAGRGARNQRSTGVASWGHENCASLTVVADVFAMCEADPSLFSAMFTYFEYLDKDEGTCLSRKDIVADSAWYPATSYQLMNRPMGVDHILWCFHSFARGPIDLYNGLVLYRSIGRRDFSGRDRAIVRQTHSLTAPLVGGPLAQFSDPSPMELSPQQRRVLACLLEGDTDRQIAFRLGLHRFTVNDYTKRIYKHFKVRSRTELMARWIRRGWGNGFPWMP